MTPGIGLLVITHAGLGESLVDCAKHVFGSMPERLRALGVVADADPEQVLARAQALVAELDDGSGVLVLTDLFGATPANIAFRLARPDRIAVVAGVNLPMLLRSIGYRSGALRDVVAKATEGGRSGIVEGPA